MYSLIATQKVVVNWGDMTIGQRFTLNIFDGFPRIEIGGEGINSTTAMNVGVWHHLTDSFSQKSVIQIKC